MELRRHLQVLWRFRVLIGAGAALGVALAALSLLTIGSGGPEFRQKVIWSSLSTVYVTQAGFPEGRVLAEVPEDAVVPPGAGKDAEKKAGEQPFFADPARFASLALLYSYLLSSDELKGMIAELPSDAEIVPTVQTDGSGSKATTLPLLNIEARATDPGDARRLNGDAIYALKRFVASRQAENNIQGEDRVQLSIVTPPKEAEVAEGRSYTGAIVLFILCSLLALGIAYVLENLNPAYAVPYPAEGAFPPQGRNGHNGTVPFDSDADAEPEPEPSHRPPAERSASTVQDLPWR